ncbi:rhamnogalacturonan acetylesterase [Edaphobacter sp. HDX4]|uniref:rhamnogalacturonan acetylesterase n=1 Tax=Edaphobacter sp. HDX4 TaxID=2794064 RepID=UPI002FE6480A
MKVLWAAGLLCVAAMSASAAPVVLVCGKTASARFSASSAEFDLVAPPVQQTKAGCASDAPFFISFPATDGNYRVTVELGGDAAADTTVRAESRRLMLEQEKTRAGQYRKESFVVNVRTPEIAGGDRVHLKPREIGALDWDDKLTLEFNGDHPSVRKISVEAVSDVPTVYLAGDSTVVDQDKEPWAAWGQMLPRFFGPKVAIANHAESGETIRSFETEKRWEKIFSTLKRGDYLMLQFAHNDQKPGRGYVPAATDYTALVKKYVAKAEAIGAHPILVTSMNRRTFDDAGKITDSLAPYPQTLRQIAEAEKLPLVDLNTMSKVMWETMGPDGTLKAFVHYPANTFPGQTEALSDNTHFNSYGAYELARCVVQSLREQKSPLVKWMRPGIPAFDPAHPDPAFTLPRSPMVDTATPYGR